MPPFLPRKRLTSTPPPTIEPTPAKRPKFTTECGSVSRQPPNVSLSKHFSIGESDSDSSLSEIDSDNFEDVQTDILRDGSKVEAHENDEDEDIDWEDAAPGTEAPLPPQREIGDIQLTFRKDEADIDYGTVSKASSGKKGPTKREKQVRIQTHCMHVQFLLWHNAIRNRWICDKTVQAILVGQLPSQIRVEIEKWRVASGLGPSNHRKSNPTTRREGRRRNKRKRGHERNERDWGKPSQRLEQGKPDLSHGDPLIHLMRVLSQYWKKRFAITVPGLRKRGYGTKLALKQEISSLRNDEHDPERHGEKIKDLKEFRDVAKKSEGSRDVGAQLFTALLRGLGIEARLVASLQPSGFGWTKAEQMLSRKGATNSHLESSDEGDSNIPRPRKPVNTKKKTSVPRSSTKNRVSATPGNQSTPIDLDSEDEEGESMLSDPDSVVDVTPSMPKPRKSLYDRDLAFPIYWTEAISPITNAVLPVSPLVLENPVAATLEVLASFEPRGAKAEKGKQILAYVVAYSPDGTAKDVTVRYLRKRLWPGKTKGFRMPIEKIPVYNKRGEIKYYEDYDWFKHTISGYVRTEDMRTAVDDVEDANDLVPAEPEKKNLEDEGDTLQSLKASADFVLERHLRREEALRPDAEPDRMFTTGKADEIIQEPVYRRSDVERCLTAESWHKEGRRPKKGENPMKMVPVRAVTLTRKREAEDHLRQTGQKQMQGLYSWDQTEYIIPPPIKDGIIPKNAYGNMDCFVPSMVPKGAVHIPLRGTIRICKKLEIDFAEAVTGFEFGNKRAVPVCTGVVVAAENENKVKVAWEKWNEEQRKKEKGKMEKICLDLWRKMIMGLRIRERIVGDVVDEDQRTDHRGTNGEPIHVVSDADDQTTRDADGETSGGFMLPHEDEDVDIGELIMEQAEPVQSQRKKRNKAAYQYPTPTSVPAPKAKARKTTKSLLRETSSELSEPASGGTSDLDAADTSDHADYSHSDQDSEAVSKSVSDDSMPFRLPRTQMKNSCGGATLPDQDTCDRNSSPDPSSPDTETEAEEYTPRITRSGRMSTTRADNAVNPPPRPPGSTSRKVSARRADPKIKAQGSATPKRRVLRRDSTLVTSPYFDG